MDMGDVDEVSVPSSAEPIFHPLPDDAPAPTEPPEGEPPEPPAVPNALPMDSADMIRKFKDFLEQHYLAQLLESLRKGERHLVVDFQKLAIFDPQLGDLVLDQPHEAVKAGELAVREFDPNAAKFVLRFNNMPHSAYLMLRHVRSKHLGKLIFTEGIVRQKSDVRPQVTEARFECPTCNTQITMLQLEQTFREPMRCSCGRKGKFKLLSKELVDAQSISLEEAPEELEGGEQPKRMGIFLKNDLVSPITEKRTNPGAKIRITGMIKEVPITSKSGGQSVRFDLQIEANHVEPVDEDLSDISISKEELAQILALRDDPHLERRIVESVAPNIFGHERIKEALALQLLGGVRKVRDDRGGTTTRGDIHILLVGDPGSGKSQLLKRIARVALRGRFISGKGVSGAGLTASVVKDEFLSGWSLEAGALVLANRGICCIDELDKMSEDDRAAMHEALEGQTITIAKANIQATLRAETTVLAAANPKLGRFDPYDMIAKQIDLPPTLINRFDLIFPIKDLPDPIKDNQMASFILDLHRNEQGNTAPIDTQLLRKYIAYAKTHSHPHLTDEAIDQLKDYYTRMRGSSSKESGVIKSIPITPRQLEGLVRLSEARARMRLGDTVTAEDARRAVELLDYCLRQVALDEQTGQIDIDRISSDTSSRQRNKILVIKEIFRELEAKVGKVVLFDDIKHEATLKGISDAELDEIMNKLKNSGDIFEPKAGRWSRI
jgi:replicative DNA helicase Mcm